MQYTSQKTFFSGLVVLIGLCALLASVPAAAQKSMTFATTLLDQDIENEVGEKIGEVDDLVIKRSGRVKKMEQP